MKILNTPTEKPAIPHTPTSPHSHTLNPSSPLIFTILLAMLATLSSCDTATGELDGDLAVIEAFLFAGEPVEDIRVTSTVLFNSDDTVSAPVNDAVVRLIKNGATYPLTARGDDGYYFYSGDDLVVEPGDHFVLEMDYLGQRATAETDVPPEPARVALDSTVMVVPSFDFSDGPPRRPPAGGPGGLDNRLLVTWDNSADQLHYVVVRGLLEDHEAIFPEFIGQRIGQFRFISAPTRDNFFEINLQILDGLGAHEVRVYRVNQEYADLYENREQDSRDLNEPPSNVDGALGIFSAFNSVAIPFNVVRDDPS